MLVMRDVLGKTLHGDVIVDVNRRVARVEIPNRSEPILVTVEGWPGEGDGIRFQIWDGGDHTSGLTISQVLCSQWFDQVKWACKGLEGIRKEWQRKT